MDTSREPGKCLFRGGGGGGGGGGAHLCTSSCDICCEHNTALGVGTEGPIALPNKLLFVIHVHVVVNMYAFVHMLGYYYPPMFCSIQVI